VAIPLSDRVPGRASGPSQSRVDDDSGSRCVSGKLIGYLGFSRRGLFMGEGAASEVDQGGLTHRGRGQGLGCAALLCGQPVAPLRILFGLLVASLNNRRFGFCFIHFREYFLCNFSETQKHQKTGNWHCGILLIGYFRKMHKNATKCNKTLSKWCNNKHGASKIIDTFETYQYQATHDGSWGLTFTIYFNHGIRILS
jgi:hypothetical protein